MRYDLPVYPEHFKLTAPTRSEMARRFASLRTLDQKPFDPSIAFSARPDSSVLDGPGLSSRVKSEKAKAAKREPVVFPVEPTSGFFESDGARDFVAQFFLKCVYSFSASSHS